MSLNLGTPSAGVTYYLGYTAAGVDYERIRSDNTIKFIPRGVWSTSKAVPNMFRREYLTVTAVTNQVSVVYYIYDTHNSAAYTIGDWKIHQAYASEAEAAQAASALKIQLEDEKRFYSHRVTGVYVFTTTINKGKATNRTVKV